MCIKLHFRNAGAIAGGTDGAMRLDSYLFENGLTESREKARALIMEGKVNIDGRQAAKPGMEVKEGAAVVLAGDPIPFVSRGGLKLQKALEVFQLELSGAVAADIGASTGGFTDCMLQHGASRVYALDVGYGQLDWRLRTDPRVVVMERTNARFMEPGWFDPKPGFASIDVSFISLRLILAPLYACLSDGAFAVALIKPQFEAGRAQIGKHGVVRDESVHEAVCRQVLGFAAGFGFAARELSFSPVTGPKGNIEFLALLQKYGELPAPPAFQGDDMRIRDAVRAAHAKFFA